MHMVVPIASDVLETWRIGVRVENIVLLAVVTARAERKRHIHQWLQVVHAARFTIAHNLAAELLS